MTEHHDKPAGTRSVSADLDALVHAWPGRKHSQSPEYYVEFECPVCDDGDVFYRWGHPALVCQSGAGCDPHKVIEVLETGRLPTARESPPPPSPAATGGEIVPPLPPDIERCAKHGDELHYACPSCLVVRAQVERYARARAVARERMAMVSEEAWRPVDLSKAETLPPRSLLFAEPHDPNGSPVPLLRPGQVAGVHGLSGGGKTTLAYLGCVQEVKAGHLVLIVDHEMRQVQAKDALRSLGMTDAEMAEGVVYFEDPPAMDDFYFDRLMQALTKRMDAAGWPLTFGVFDSVSRSMGKVVGWTTNDELHVNAWYDSLVRRLLKEFPRYAPFTIDHPGRTDGPEAIGSHAKGAGPDFHLWCRSEQKFAWVPPPGSGHSVLQVVKGRGTDLPLETDLAEVTVVNGHFRLRMLPPPPPPKAGETDVPLDRMSAASATEEEVLADLRAAETVGQLTTEVTGSGEGHGPRKAALARLLRRRLVAWRRVPGTSTGKRWWSAEFAPDDASTDS